jgi:hypothetical protein
MEWSAKITANPDMPPNDTDAFISAEFLFTAPDRGKAMDMMRGTIRDLHLWDKAGIYSLKPHTASPEAKEEFQRPERRSNGDVRVTIAEGREVVLTENMEYEFATRIQGIDHADRYWRMGFLGIGGPGGDMLIFNARGPDRDTSGKFAGTQHIIRESIKDIAQVPKDPAARYAAKRSKP